MSLIKVDQHSLLPRFSNLWEDLWGKDILEMTPESRGVSIPAVNIEEKEDAFEVAMAVPGMKRDDFKIEVDNGVLSVAAEKEAEHATQDKEGQYTRREFRYHTFRRAFTLPEAVEQDEIAANYTDGILAIHLPKKELSKKQLTRQITVK